MKILRTTIWYRRTGYLGAAVSGQVTELESGGVRAYVRENFVSGGFHLSSNARLGLGGGVVRGKIRNGGAHLLPQILELAAPAAHWERIAQLVTGADRQCRPVRRNRQWTTAKARQIFET